MLRSNSKKAIENVRSYIINKFDCSEYGEFDYIGNDKTDYLNAANKHNTDVFSLIAHAIFSTFYFEMLQFDNRYNAGKISRYEMFKEWCSGLPSIIDTGYYYNRSAVDDVAIILGENDAEKSKYNEIQAAELLTRLIYREIYKAVIR